MYNKSILSTLITDQEFLHDINRNNQNGSSGKLVQCFAELLQRMWNREDEIIKPDTFMVKIY